MIEQKNVKLVALKAFSFVTSLDEEALKVIRGGSGADQNTTHEPFC